MERRWWCSAALDTTTERWDGTGEPEGGGAASLSATANAVGGAAAAHLAGVARPSWGKCTRAGVACWVVVGAVPVQPRNRELDVGRPCSGCWLLAVSGPRETCSREHDGMRG